MSSNDESTDPGISAKAHKAALATQEAARSANAWADPKVDSLLGHVMASKISAAILLVSHGAAFVLGMWAAWPKK
jgi:hypothetical protein